jgi:hypothetical protein
MCEDLASTFQRAERALSGGANGQCLFLAGVSATSCVSSKPTRTLGKRDRPRLIRDLVCLGRANEGRRQEYDHIVVRSS